MYLANSRNNKTMYYMHNKHLHVHVSGLDIHT